MAQTWLAQRLGARARGKPRERYQRNVYLLLLFTLGKGFQLSIASISIALYLASLHYSYKDIGLILAMPAIGSLAAGAPMGFLADRIGRKPLLLISGFLNPLAIAAIALSTSEPFLIAASLTNGFLASAYWVTNLPMLTESTTEDQRVGVFALNSFLLLGVGALGALIGGFVPEIVAGYLHVHANTPVPLRFGVIAGHVHDLVVKQQIREFFSHAGAIRAPLGLIQYDVRVSHNSLLKRWRDRSRRRS